MNLSAFAYFPLGFISMFFKQAINCDVHHELFGFSVGWAALFKPNDI